MNLHHFTLWNPGRMIWCPPKTKCPHNNSRLFEDLFWRLHKVDLTRPHTQKDWEAPHSTSEKVSLEKYEWLRCWLHGQWLKYSHPPSVEPQGPSKLQSSFHFRTTSKWIYIWKSNPKPQVSHTVTVTLPFNCPLPPWSPPTFSTTSLDFIWDECYQNLSYTYLFKRLIESSQILLSTTWKTPCLCLSDR